MVTEGPWSGLARSWERSLKAANKSPRTQVVYLHAVTQLAAWMTANQPQAGPAGITRQHLEGFLVDYAEGHAASTVASTYRSLQQWFKWLVEEDELEHDPTARMKVPAVPEKLLPVLTDDEIRLLLKTCEGRAFIDRRDVAIVRMLVDTGMRRGELCGITLPDLDVDEQVVTVLGKGRRDRVLPFGVKTAQALDRYLRARAGHPRAMEVEFWLGERGRGPLQPNGLNQMLWRRGEQAGLGKVHPHQFRHTMSHRWLVAGGCEGDLMSLNGWKSRSMLQRYGASVAAQRARDSHRRLGLGDQL